MRIRRTGIISAATAAVTLLSVSAATAEDFLWSGYWREATAGMESRRWSDEQYSQVLYRNCSGPRSSSGSKPYNTDIQMHRDISAWPDADYDNKTFSECFKGYMHQSNGEWHDLPKGQYYFSVEAVRGGVGKLDVEVVMVDNTSAD
ncbi:hypothetical protein ACFPM3_30485 [Streptomyces coeruleoprunus]|uniref:Secreted protein n=1 Tax=Streptomyces coeruleoprunus TaxID=285563 RepID=A0ABV9XPF4_9ACTN